MSSNPKESPLPRRFLYSRQERYGSGVIYLLPAMPDITVRQVDPKSLLMLPPSSQSADSLNPSVRALVYALLFWRSCVRMCQLLS